MLNDTIDHREDRRGRPSRNAGRSNLRGSNLRGIVAGAAVVSALGCAWTLGNHFAARHAGTNVADLRFSHQAPATFAERSIITERATFADRFGSSITQVLATAPPPADAATSVAALLDPNPSLGSAPGIFRKRLPAVPAGWSATPTQQAEIAIPRLLPSQPLRQVALQLPQATPQPSVLRLPEPATTGSAHERLVQRATASLLAQAASGKASIFEKLLGKLQPAGPVLAYAGPDSGLAGFGTSLAPTSALDRVTAVYDITKRVVYMPDGSKLEAHSGLGSRLDDPDYAHERMRGVTPPHIYDLKPREALFHGVAALRMTPIGGEGAIHGRSGILAHTYMLGPNGDSNGCISFKDYNAFLRAYRNGDVKRIVVVGKLD